MSKQPSFYVQPRVADRDRVLQGLLSTKPGTKECGPLIDALHDANHGMVNLALVAANMRERVLTRLNGNRYVRWSAIEWSGATFNLIINFCIEFGITPEKLRLTRINGLPAKDIISFTEKEHTNAKSNSRLGLPFRRRKPDPRAARRNPLPTTSSAHGITIESILKQIGESGVSDD